uniref:Uncharacterized protein n=1 Tax=Oryza glumipatula TaxID=40148 RepID=A0A0E0AQR9_9ORYZ
MAAQEPPPPFASASTATRARGDMASPSPGEGGESHTSETNPEKRERIQDQLAAAASAAAPTGPVPKKMKSSETTTAGSTTLASRPLPLRYPPYPTLPPRNRPTRKYLDSVLEWAKECRRIAKLSQKDITTLRDDPITADAVVTSQDKAMVLRVARSIVSVSSTMPDGGGLVSRCTGVVIGWDGANKRAKILTAASVVSDFNGELHNPALKKTLAARGIHKSKYYGHPNTSPKIPSVWAHIN